MFKQLKNIESAFRHIRLFSFILILAAVLLSCYSIYKSYAFAERLQQQVVILPDGKAMQAIISTRKDNIPVEGRRHVNDFHTYFFTLAPDDKAIEENIKKALYLADGSAKRVYDDLKENGYYSQVISSNISQELQVDSIVVHQERHPYYFKFYGKERIMRPMSVTIRSLITEGYLRDLQTRTDNNPNGFLIEKWSILENKDIQVQKR
jgi:conjugative transposon TraK protein